MNNPEELVAKYRDTLSKKGGIYVTRDEFLREHGLSMPALMRAGLSGFSELVARAQGPAPSNIRLDEAELLDDYCRVSEHVGRPPSVDMYRAHGNHSPTNMTKRCGGTWQAVNARAAQRAEELGKSALADLLRSIKVLARKQTTVPRAEEPAYVSEPKTSDLPHLNEFDASARQGAEKMAKYYSRLYSLERQMRRIIVETLSASKGNNWWVECVAQDTRDYAKSTLENEEKTGVTPRSSRLIDYTTLGHLGGIVNQNWPLFASRFKNQQAMVRIMRDLNLLRAFVAHCTPLPQDEVIRLDLAIKDWIRQLRI